MGDGMELDYKELQAIAAMQKRLKQEHRLPSGRYYAWAVIPLLVVSQLISGPDRHSLYHTLLVCCLIGWAVLFSVTESIYRRRSTKQLTVLLDVARRVMDNDPANYQKLNELQTMKMHG
jgi:hypothetical protein